ncbi:MAG: WbqC family protein [Flavobacteriales bacterium]|nr:WbqC family protein [Flavobacteriales bacterium]
MHQQPESDHGQRIGSIRSLFPVVKASPNKKISETPILSDNWATKLLATIRQAYARAPQFKTAFPLIEGVFTSGDLTIDRLAARSISAVCDHLGLNTQLITSSSGYGNAERSRSSPGRHMQTGARHNAHCSRWWSGAVRANRIRRSRHQPPIHSSHRNTIPSWE